MRGSKALCSLILTPSAFASLLLATTSFANTYTWNNAATGTAWNATSNWGGTVPGSADVGQFNFGAYALQPSGLSKSSLLVIDL